MSIALPLSLVSGQAAAHAILVDSTPKPRSTVPAGPAQVTLRFNSRIDHERSRLVLRSGTTETPLPIAQAGPADTLTASASLTAGEHVVRWQVLAIDGHITRGDVPFTVKIP